VSGSDEVIRLREWGSERIHALPRTAADAWLVSADETGALELTDQPAPDKQALLTCAAGQWSICDLGTRHGLRQDGVRRDQFVLEPGVELGIGETTLIAETGRAIELRRFCARILGWAPDRAHAVDQALRSIRLGAMRRAALVLCGDHDLVPIAWALHRRTLGTERPLIVCDPRRGNTPASVRSPANYESGVIAFEAAIGGTLFVRRSRLPRDFAQVVARLRAPDAGVQLVVSADHRDAGHAFLTGPAPIRVPPLDDRADELPRIIEEYAIDAIAELGASEMSFTEDDRRWIVEHAAMSLPEIEKATLRLVALKSSRSLGSAAKRLGMAPVSLSRWVGRRPHPVHPDP
jgi:hypothetical protein